MYTNIFWHHKHKISYFQDDKSQRTVTRKFSEKTSLQGVRYIVDARRWYSKLFWITCFTGALVATSIQLYRVTEIYSYHFIFLNMSDRQL